MKMKKLLLTTITVFIMACMSEPLWGQDNAPKLELGGQFTLLRLGDFYPENELFRSRGLPTFPERRVAEPGVGGRVTYNINDNVAVEAQADFFPRNVESSDGGFNFNGGGKDLFVFGAKLGVRKKRIGFFGKVRPGVARFAGYPRVRVFEQFPSGGIITIQGNVQANFFAADVGGVVELYPSRRTMVRFDLGDTIIRYGEQNPREFNPAFTRHNLQFSAGFAIRFR